LHAAALRITDLLLLLQLQCEFRAAPFDRRRQLRSHCVQVALRLRGGRLQLCEGGTLFTQNKNSASGQTAVGRKQQPCCDDSDAVPDAHVSYLAQ